MQQWYQSYGSVDFFLSMLCGCSIVWSSTSEKINSFLLENHPCFLKLQWEFWRNDHCQSCVDAMNLQLSSWRCKDCESCWICKGVRVWWNALGFVKDVVVGARLALCVMYDGDLICVSHDLRHVREGSTLRFTDMLQQKSMEVLRKQVLCRRVLRL